MKRTEAIELLGGTVKTASIALNLTTQAIYAWPEVLSRQQEANIRFYLSDIAPKARGSKNPGRAAGKSRAQNKSARVA